MIPADPAHPPYLSWRIWDGSTATALVWSVSSAGWLLLSADGVSVHHPTRPFGSWESTPAEVTAWEERRRAFAPAT